jgi:hypothetical protein
MKSLLNLVAAATAAAFLGGCASSTGYSPPPERRAGEKCPVGETWVCKDRYPSRLERENEIPQICYCESLHRIR